MDADGEEDDTLPPTNGSKSFPTIKDPALSIPEFSTLPTTKEGEGRGGIDENCFMSTSLDGLVLIWDKRTHSTSSLKKGGVSKLEDFGKELDRLGLAGGAGEGREGGDEEKKVKGKGKGRDKWCAAVSSLLALLLTSFRHCSFEVDLIATRHVGLHQETKYTLLDTLPSSLPTTSETLPPPSQPTFSPDQPVPSLRFVPSGKKS